MLCSILRPNRVDIQWKWSELAQIFLLLNLVLLTFCNLLVYTKENCVQNFWWNLEHLKWIFGAKCIYAKNLCSNASLNLKIYLSHTTFWQGRLLAKNYRIEDIFGLIITDFPLHTWLLANLRPSFLHKISNLFEDRMRHNLLISHTFQKFPWNFGLQAIETEHISIILPIFLLIIWISIVLFLLKYPFNIWYIFVKYIGVAKLGLTFIFMWSFLRTFIGYRQIWLLIFQIC